MNIRLNTHISGKWFHYHFEDVSDLSDVASLVRNNILNFHQIDEYDVQVQGDTATKADVRQVIQRVIELGPEVVVVDPEQEMMARWAASLKR